MIKKKIGLDIIMNTKKKKKQTFIVEIIDHQKSTWQGQIHWIQGNERVSFRSVMEMLRLMDSAIGKEDEDDQQADDERDGGE